MSGNITQLLEAASQGSNAASEELFQVVYRELRHIARSQRRSWVGNETLNTTALIHEAYLKLNGKQDWGSRTHYYATAAKAMRHLLVNYAEKRATAKRGGDTVTLSLDEVLVPTNDAAAEALTMHQVLERLERDRPRWCRIIECRFYGGMSIAETATALDISTATVSRDWLLASAWLRRELQEEDRPQPTPE